MDSKLVNRRTALMGLAGIGAAGIGAGRLDRPRSEQQAGQPGQAQSGRGNCDFVVSSDDAIQATVDVADPGDTICVEPASYAESITIDVEDLTLRATESREAIIDATGLGSGVSIEADGVTLEGFDIAGDDDTTTGVSIVTSAGATEGITVRDNHVHGMAKGGGGGPFGVASWGLLSWGDTPLSGVLVEDNLVEDIGGEDAGFPVGIGIDLEEVEGDRPRGGAVVRRNTLRDVFNAELSFFTGGPSRSPGSASPSSRSTASPATPANPRPTCDGTTSRRRRWT